MNTTINSLTRAFKGPKPEVSEVPALVRPETWEDVGTLTIGPKSYGFRIYPGHLTCTKVVRLFTDGGFAADGYDVTFHTDGPTLCTCPDFTYRQKANKNETCRHIRAVVALELHTAPPVPPAPPADDDCGPEEREELERYGNDYEAAAADAALTEWVDQPIPYDLTDYPY